MIERTCPKCRKEFYITPNNSICPWCQDKQTANVLWILVGFVIVLAVVYGIYI